MKKPVVYISLAVAVVAGIALIYALGGGGTTADGPKGKVELENPGGELVLDGGALGTESISSSSGPVEVTAGTYDITRITFTGKQGTDTWQITSKPESSVAVEPNEAKVVKAGAPFEIFADVQGSGPAVSIGFSILGQTGEKYTDIQKNGQRAPAPTLKIVGQNGEELASGQFEYG